MKFLVKSLENKNPIIALIDPSIIYGGIKGIGHFVVIIGIENGKVVYHDPDAGNNLSVALNLFFESWKQYKFKGVKIWKSTKK